MLMRAVVAKITPNVWDIVQLSMPITLQLYIGFWQKKMSFKRYWHEDYIVKIERINYRIYSCIMCTFFSQILPLKSRCTLYTEPFVFIWGNLHNTKTAKLNNSQFYVTSRNKSRQKVCLALYITSVHIRQCQWHQSSVMQLVYDHDWKSVALSLVFPWHSKIFI